MYCSGETHTWIQKATDLGGFGTDSIRWIATDSKLRMDVSALRRQIEADAAAGDVPFLVVGMAGSVSTGAVDPLPEISALCKEYGLWFHVDGAYGDFAAAVPQAHDDLRGLTLEFRLRLIRTNGSTRRSRPDAHWYAIPKCCGPRLRITLPTTISRSG